MENIVNSKATDGVLVRRRSKVHLYAHFVWRTRGSEPRLTPGCTERLVHRAIAGEAIRLGCKLFSLNGMPDHVHLLVRIPSALCTSVLVKQIKGVSAAALNDAIREQDPLAMRFRWQDGYACFSVGMSELDSVIAYIRDQKRHHSNGELWSDWEETDECSYSGNVLPEGCPAERP